MQSLSFLHQVAADDVPDACADKKLQRIVSYDSLAALNWQLKVGSNQEFDVWIDESYPSVGNLEAKRVVDEKDYPDAGADAPTLVIVCDQGPTNMASYWLILFYLHMFVVCFPDPFHQHTHTEVGGSHPRS